MYPEIPFKTHSSDLQFKIKIYSFIYIKYNKGLGKLTRYYRVNALINKQDNYINRTLMQCFFTRTV